MSNYTVSIHRAASCTSAETVNKMESADGNRRAHGRVIKKSVGMGRWEPVVAYTLRERINGKFKVVRSGYNKEYAEKFVNYKV